MSIETDVADVAAKATGGIWLYVIAAVVGAALGGAGVYEWKNNVDSAALAKEQAAHATDNTKAALASRAVSDLAASTVSAALTKQQAAEVAQAQASAAAQKAQDEATSANTAYRELLAGGTQRVYLRATCPATPAGSSAVPGAAAGGPSSDAEVSVQLSPATATTLFDIATDHDDAVRTLNQCQATVCRLSPLTPGCAAP